VIVRFNFRRFFVWKIAAQRFPKPVPGTGQPGHYSTDRDSPVDPCFWVSGRSFCYSCPDLLDKLIEDIGKLARTQGRDPNTFRPNPEDGHPPTTHFNRQEVEQRGVRAR
jgi:hypothetical protein